MKNTIKLGTLKLCIFLSVSLPASAQIVFSGEDNPLPNLPGDDDPSADIDQSLIILLIAAIVLGYWYLKMRNTKPEIRS